MDGWMDEFQECNIFKKGKTNIISLETFIELVEKDLFKHSN